MAAKRRPKKRDMDESDSDLTLSKKPTGRGIQSIEIGFSILDVLCKANGPLPLRRIAQKCDMAVANVHAAVFGIAGKAGAEIAIDEINAAGGVDGVKLRMLVIDEGVGSDRLLSEYRRLVQEERVTLSSAAISNEQFGHAAHKLEQSGVRADPVC